MQRINVQYCLFVIILSLLFTTNLMADSNETAVQDDTVKVRLTSTPPIIDGRLDDTCWQDARWQTIDQVWITYGDSVPPEDFSGRYKTVWSDAENVLYFIVEIIDDVFVDGYVYDSDPGAGGGYPNYDIVEVFIDEDKSGGLHVFDGTGTTGQQWGTNAENAFSYHIAVNCPNDGEATTDCVVCDIAGQNWGSYYIPDYATHFPQFAMRKNGTQYLWEFSLAVYNDTYDDGNPQASRAQLNEGKMMGLSIAYCDNDDPNENPKKRDNFFGSVWVPEEANNDHWMNADGFGSLQLVGSDFTGLADPPEVPSTYVYIYPNPTSGFIRVLMNNRYTGNLKIRLYDMLGREVFNTILSKMQNQIQKVLHIPNLPCGVYFLEASIQGKRYIRKVLMTNF